MKQIVILFLSCFFIISGISAQLNLSFPVAKFKAGDDMSWKERDFDDSSWRDIKTSITWERQGYHNLDGYAWYRIRFFLPKSLLATSYLKEYLNFYIARIDDVEEVYINGKFIGKTGTFPFDKEGFVSAWEIQRHYLVSATEPALRWDEENILAIRVYDRDGQGGIYGDVPTLQMFDLVDGLDIDYTTHSDYIESQYQIILQNKLKETQQGKLQIVIEDTQEGKIINSFYEDIHIAPSGEFLKNISFPGNKRIKVYVVYTDNKTKKFKYKEIVSKYILTPPASEFPRINSPKVYGARPGNPFLFSIAASGIRPMSFEAKGLPEGLTLDKKTGIITGKATKKGDYKVVLSAKNANGTATGELLLKIGDEIALTPPMGWNSWNCWGLNVDNEKMLQSARAFIEKGLTQYGWSYINLDGGWQDTRDSKGNIVPNSKFPNMKALGDSLHKMGLKFGMYTSPGPRDCADYMGSYQHEEQDLKTFVGWGIDFLKYDWCSYSEVFNKENDTSLSAYMKPYLLMQKYLREQNRDIVYSLCQYGFKNVWEWGAAVGNCWRTTWDIVDTWESLSEIGFNQYPLYPYAKPGHWNDPDMLIVGKVGWSSGSRDTRLTTDEQYTHISLWSLLASPLLLGCDLSQLDAFTLSLLTNHEVLEVNQDPLGKQAARVIVNKDIQVWMKEMEDGSKAIGIFNLGDKDENYDLLFSSLDIPQVYSVRDVWRQVDIPNITTSIRLSIPSHGVSLIRVK